MARTQGKRGGKSKSRENGHKNGAAETLDDGRKAGEWGRAWYV